MVLQRHAAVALLLVVGSSTFVAAQQAPPNIVLILADDLGYGDLGCYGAKRYATPNADRLAREGMRFTDAHSPSAVCSPTRYGLLTGRYCWRTWLKNWVLFERMPLLIETDRVTIGSLLQSAGYRTGCVGKWHLGWGDALEWDFAAGAAPGPLEVGFEYFFGVPHSHNSSKRSRCYVEGRRAVGLRPGESLDDAETRERLARDLTRTAKELSERAIDFVMNGDDRPFFLYYPTTNVHFPLTPDAEFVGQGEAGVYGEFAIECDWAIGQLLEALERRGVADNTLLVLTSDNGARPTDGMNGHEPNGPWRGTKRTIYEGGHRVPMIVRWPGKVAAGSECQEAVCLTDWLATLAEAIDRPLPSGAGEDSDSILPALLGEQHASPLRRPIIHHSVAGTFAIRSGDWKLVETGYHGDYWRDDSRGGTGGAIQRGLEGLRRDLAAGSITELRYEVYPPEEHLATLPPYQLFDLRSDPGETRNLYRERPEVVERLAAELESIRGSSGRSPEASR